MNRLFFFLCALCLVLAFGTAFAASPSKGISTTLNDIPPAWSRTLQCDTTACPRFELVLGGAAVLDHETGLVWEKTPSLPPVNWYLAVYDCALLTVGNRQGWHLPTIEQLASLLEGSVLPEGNPFTGVQSAGYWSATTSPLGADQALGVSFQGGFVQGGLKAPLEGGFYVWCVRGGQSNDGQ